MVPSFFKSIQNVFSSFFEPHSNQNKTCVSGEVNTVELNPVLDDFQVELKPNDVLESIYTEAQSILNETCFFGKLNTVGVKTVFENVEVESKPEGLLESIGQNLEERLGVTTKDSSTQTDFSSTANLKRKKISKGKLDSRIPKEKCRRKTRRDKKAKKRAMVLNSSSRFPIDKMRYVNRFKRTRPYISKKKRDIILFQYPNDSPSNILYKAANDLGVIVQYNFSKNGPNHECAVLMKKNELARAEGDTQKAALMNAAAAGLQQLQKYYYTVRVKGHRYKTILRNDFMNLSAERKRDPLDRNNLGFRMMTSMGWSETDGLGKSSQGITQPIIPVQKFKRRGIGFEHDQQKNKFIQKCLNVLEDYIRQDTLDELEFLYFTVEEMNMIQYAARKMSLASKRAGKKKRLVRVMRVRSDKEKFNLLLKVGGSLGRYQLIKPTIRDCISLDAKSPFPI
ncbi:hypothetical protein QAD02_010436 [Eretmocerus hayati]|uniref:Uncharacterized protein n=1 Tax=Eretmocerus hayati TaxID=131215 RepID=A0ACC2NTR8_9HYME|nr:hypothetical protein QAD02_010436 [Eretmocerus hayati]